MLYGYNGMSGVADFGKTPEDAVSDFIRSWKQLSVKSGVKNNMRKV